MIEQLINRLDSIPWEQLLPWLFGLSLICFVGSIVGVWIVLIRLPADYLIRDGGPVSNDSARHLLQFSRRIVQNVFGIVFLLMGMVMLLTPGQGILSIFVGITLLDFPGKQKLIRRILSNSKVLNAINNIREKCQKAPLMTELHPQSDIA